jgi:two-component system response regulator AlgR
MKILIVDDEPPARSLLRSLVEELQAGEVIGEAANGLEALHRVSQEMPDIVLLDIRMPGMDGLEVARHLAHMDQPPAVIFVTAYDSYAVQAFEAQALDYLLKPLHRDRLQTALFKARRFTRAQVRTLEEMQDSHGVEARTHLSATLHGRLQLVPVAEIRYFRADQKYVSARYPGGELLLSDSLSALEEEFAEQCLRVHRNALVAVCHVTSMEKAPSGNVELCFSGVEERIPVSRRLTARVRKALKNRAGNHQR